MGQRIVADLKRGEARPAEGGAMLRREAQCRLKLIERAAMVADRRKQIADFKVRCEVVRQSAASATSSDSARPDWPFVRRNRINSRRTLRRASVASAGHGAYSAL